MTDIKHLNVACGHLFFHLPWRKETIGVSGDLGMTSLVAFDGTVLDLLDYLYKAPEQRFCVHSGVD